MSGGGAMRAAAVAKAAGITVANTGFRGIASEHPVSSAARKVVLPVSVSGISSSSDHLKSSAVSASQSTAVDGAPVQWPCRELDGWEFAGGEEEEMVAAGEPLPRLVFGGAPSLQEAKEATFDLKDALHKVYNMSSPPSDCGSTNVAAQVNGDHSPSSSSSSLAITRGAPKHAIQAFKFLYENAAAQTVVASIASDPNVWNAVLANPELQEFLVSQKTSASVLDGEYSVEESVAETDFLRYSSPRSDEFTSEDGSPKPGNGFTDLLQNIKVAVLDMMNCLSDFFQNLFGGSKVFADADGSAKISAVDKALGASFMGLAIMAIMVVVLKRA
nr:Homeobox-leucine zipper protein [Ipomoea batatas]